MPTLTGWPMPKPLLTRKKSAWAKQFKPRRIQGKPLTVNAGVTQWYAAKLGKLAGQMVAETEREVVKVFTQANADGASMDASPASQGRIVLAYLKRKFMGLMGRKAKTLVASMILRTDKASASGLGESLKDLSGGLVLKTSTMPPALQEAVKATIVQNVSLISSITVEYHSKVEGAVMRSITSGNGLADLVTELKDIGGVTMRRARLVAHDQTAKAYLSFAKHRMQAAGITKFKWLHSGASRVPREYHRDVLHGQIFEVANPPMIDEKTKQRGLPGDLIGCRCRMVPVIEFADGGEA